MSAPCLRRLLDLMPYCSDVEIAQELWIIIGVLSEMLISKD